LQKLLHLQCDFTTSAKFPGKGLILASVVELLQHYLWSSNVPRILVLAVISITFQ